MMEEITTAFIFINILIGAIIGFISLASKESRLFLLFQGVGAIIVIIQLLPFLSTPSPDMSINNATAQVSNSFQNMIAIIIPYALADAASSAGASIFLGPRH